MLQNLDRLGGFPDEQVVLLVSGSQGEPMSALTRLASSEHRQLRVHRGDTVIMSSRFIPGNTRAITRVINNLYRLGAEVHFEQIKGIHASGHAHRDELREMLATTRPRFFIPLHGEYRHLVKHARLAVECGVMPERAIVLEDGRPITFLPDTIRLEDTVFSERVLVDGKGVGDVGQTVLKERQLLAEEGIVVVTMILDKETGEILLGPHLSSKGFVFEQQLSHVLDDAKCILLDIHEGLKPGQIEALKERSRPALRRFFRKVLGRDPVVVPIIIGI